MLQQLIDDAQAIVNELPTLQSAIAAVQRDLNGPTEPSLTTIAADAQDLAAAAEQLTAPLTQLQADIAAIPAATLAAGPHPILDNFVAFLAKMQSNPNVQALEQAALASLMAYLKAAIPQPATK